MHNSKDSSQGKGIKGIKAMYKKKSKSVFKHFHNWFRSHDFYGEPIQLTYKGDNTLKTSIGAMISLVIMTILVAYAVYLAISLFGRTKSTVQNTNLILDLNSATSF
jgi:hypothetical protein